MTNALNWDCFSCQNRFGEIHNNVDFVQIDSQSFTAKREETITLYEAETLTMKILSTTCYNCSTKNVIRILY